MEAFSSFNDVEQGQPSAPAAASPTTLARLLREGDVRTVFQPVVELDGRGVVGYEALSRGPAGELEQPDALFTAARNEQRLAELDQLCRSAALRNAAGAGVLAPLAVFVNVEPEVLNSDSLDELIAITQSVRGGLRVVLEITERAVGASPAELLGSVRRLRAAGWRIALDDVGAQDMSLAFMPLLRPDIVKLDLKLVQERPGPAVAGIMNAVNAYAQRTGAVILAEGIEDIAHLNTARALGATLGQGYLFGRPAPSPDTRRPTAELRLPVASGPAAEGSPFDCLPSGTPLRRSTKPLLIELSRHLEQEAVRHGATCMVVSTFQTARHFTPRTADRYRWLAENVGFVAAIGEGLEREPVPGVRGAHLPADNRLRDEWDIVVLAPHFCAALLARDRGDQGPDRERTFDFALTYDRPTVSAAAEALLAHVTASPAMYEQRSVPDIGRQPRVNSGSSRTGVSSRTNNELGHLPQSREVLHRALGSTSNGIAIADVTRPDQPLVYVNAAFERLSGRNAHDVIGKNCRVLQGSGTDEAAVARMRAAIARGEECRETVLNYRHGSDEPWWNEVFLAPIFDEAGRLVQYIGVQNDVTARMEAESALAQEKARSIAYLAEIEAMAFRDPLTGLLNRRILDGRLAAALDEARVEGTGLGLLYVDIDGFKAVNDTHGHAVGDMVLTEVAVRLRDRREPRNLIARLGGDEFLVVVTLTRSSDIVTETARFADEIRHRMRTDIAGHSVRVSIGTSTFPHDGDDFDALIHAADRRMYADKPSRPRTAS